MAPPIMPWAPPSPHCGPSWTAKLVAWRGSPVVSLLPIWLPVVALMWTLTPALAHAEEEPAEEGPAGDDEDPLFADEEPTAYARLSAGVGVGARSISIPSEGAVGTIDTGLFAAVEVGISLAYRASDTVDLGLHALYQTSLFHSIDERQPGTIRNRDVRVHRLDVGLAPTLWLDGDGTVGVTLGAGYGVSDFRPAGHLTVPTFTLAGPYARATLFVEVVPDLLGLSLAPEAQWILSVGEELTAMAIAGTGVSLGIQAAVRLQIDSWGLQLVYRERHASLDGVPDGRLSDVSRFATLRLEKRL